ncbi:MAG: hypothetical protein LQ350_003470 [Teloschistes chrysophthalmus]|nr:MAG: hypothetical protein LQ350_003470 [Niorma chrysophthalma]
MADSPLGVRDVAESPSKSPDLNAGPPRQELPDIVAPGYMVVSTQSGRVAVVTAIPSVRAQGAYSSLLVDTKTFTPSLAPTTTPSPVAASTQPQIPSSRATATAAPSHGLLTAKLAAVIVVPLVLLAIVSPILVVWYISWRRKRRLSKRHADRLSGQRPLIGGRDDWTRGASMRRNEHARSTSAPRKAKRPHRIISVPTPTFSSFNFELSRPASVGPIQSSTLSSTRRPITKNRRSATFSWGAPPPYASQSRTTTSSTPVPRLDTPDFCGSPLLETAQMVHIRPISGHQQRRMGSSSNLPAQTAAGRSNTTLAPLQRHDLWLDRSSATHLQAPDPARTRQGSGDSNAESLHHRSTLTRPFSSFQPLASPALTDISGLSFDPTLWASVTYGRDSTVSPVDDQNQTEQARPHQIV